jgi:long-chain acyl-CoA synthetase
MFAYLTLLEETIVTKYKLATLQYATCAGAPLARKIVSDFERMYGAPIINCYGITEAAGNLTAMMRYGSFPEGSSGIPYPYTSVRIVDAADQDVPVGEVGEVIAAGPQIMKEYWRLPEATTQALRGGYLHTGDFGRMDERGHVFIVDRKNDMIITGGFNVYPAEVENMLTTHPKVGQVAVFGVDDPIRGELPCAAVVLLAGQTATEEEIIAWSHEHIAAYKCPRKVIFLEDLPKSSVGKILRRELRDMYAAGTLRTVPTKG